MILRDHVTHRLAFHSTRTTSSGHTAQNRKQKTETGDVNLMRQVLSLFRYALWIQLQTPPNSRDYHQKQTFRPPKECKKRKLKLHSAIARRNPQQCSTEPSWKPVYARGDRQKLLFHRENYIRPAAKSTATRRLPMMLRSDLAAAPTGTVTGSSSSPLSTCVGTGAGAWGVSGTGAGVSGSGAGVSGSGAGVSGSGTGCSGSEAGCSGSGAGCSGSGAGYPGWPGSSGSGHGVSEACGGGG